ncbi:copper resistance CopC family protein, partial [Streptomyces spiralis]
MRLRAVRLWATAPAAVVALLLFAPAASAHTELESSSPKDGTRITHTPATVRLTFSEPVDLPEVRVTAGGGQQLPLSRPDHGDRRGNVVEVSVPRMVGQDRLALVWRVRDMEDGHPTSGTLSFALTAKTKDASASDAAAVPTPSDSVRTVWAAARWAGYLALALYVGGLVFLALLWPQGTQDRRTRRILTLAWAGGLAASLVTPGLQGAYGAMGALGDAFHLATYRDLLGTEVGIVSA